MKIILASKSLRRQELLKMMNIKYEVIVSEKEEVKNNLLTPLENGINISLEKALDVKNKTKGDRIIISCDTVLDYKGKLLGKPKSYDDSYQMLKMLSGDYHEVYSCLTVIAIKNNQEEIFQRQGSAKVYIDSLTDIEIKTWIDTKKSLDKAGGYAIQEEFGKYISKVEGDYYSIVGLPINELYHILKQIEKKE